MSLRDPDSGEPVWSDDLEFSASPRFLNGGLFSASCIDFNVSSYDGVSEKLRWRTELKGCVHGIVIEESRLFVSVIDRNVDDDVWAVVSLDKANGHELWRFNFQEANVTEGLDPDQAFISAYRVADEMLFVSTSHNRGNNAKIHSLDALSGKRLWVRNVGGQWARVSAISDGYLYVNHSSGLRCLRQSDGEELWRFREGDKFWSIAQSDGIVYAASHAGVLYAVKAQISGQGD